MTFNCLVPVTDELQIIQDKTFEIDNDQYKIIIETIKSKDLDSAAKEIYEIRAEPQRVQNKQFNFKCTFCMKSFSNSSNLRRHTNLHLPDDIYKCAFCPRKFKQREYWKKHLEVCRNKLAKAMTDWSLFETTYNQLLLNWQILLLKTGQKYCNLMFEYKTTIIIYACPSLMFWQQLIKSKPFDYFLTIFINIKLLYVTFY